MLVAINTYLVNKAADAGRYNDKFTNLDIPIEGLADAIKRGYAFCPHVKPGEQRSKANFLASGYLAVDIDKGSTIEQVMAMDHFCKYASLLYTSFSHTEEKHKFRIVFELEGPITCPERMTLALVALISIYGADKKCKDAARPFYGNTDAKLWLPGKIMSNAEVESLVERGRELTTPKHSLSAGSDKVSKHSLSRVGKTQPIRLRDGGLDYLNNIPPRTAVHCPFHGDEHASAVVLPTHTGNNCIYCFGDDCESVFFLEGTSAKSYQFDYGWESAILAEEQKRRAHFHELGLPLPQARETHGPTGYLSTALNCQPFDSKRDYSPYLITLDQPFLSLADIAIRHPRYTDDLIIEEENSLSLSGLLRSREQGAVSMDSSLDNDVAELVTHRWLKGMGITYIKSPKGTGKTTLLKGLVEYYRNNAAEPLRILLIGHRRSLIGATAKTLGLTSYLKHVDGKAEEYNSPTPFYAICLDSLMRLDPAKHQYDVIIIDEVEQVLSHLLSNTLKAKRSNIMALLQDYLKRARQVFALDADLSQLTLGVINAMDTDWPDRQEFVAINQYKPEGRSVHMYNHPRASHLLGVLVDYLRKGKRCYVCTNSRKLAKKIFRQAQQDFPDIKAVVLTSENSNAPDGQYFIQNIATEALKYDLIVSSPSLGTGIDITFPNGESHVDAVFGLFSTRHTTHFDMDQQICRVRHPKETHVWVAGETYISETDPAVIEMDIEAMQGRFVHYQGFEKSGKPIIGPVDVMHRKIYAAVAQTRRASMNRLRENFCNLKSYQGWTVTPVPYDKSLGNVGRLFMKAADDLCQKEEADRLISARRIDFDEHDRLEEENPIEPADKAAVERFRLECFYRQDIDEALLDFDADGTMRSALRYYMPLVSPDEYVFWGILESDKALMDRGIRLKMKAAMVEVLTAAGLWTERGFNTTVSVEAEAMEDFVSACRKHEYVLLEHYHIKLRSRFEEKPIQQLGVILKAFGLSWEGGKGKRDQSNGGSRMLYTIDKAAHERLLQGCHMHTDAERLRQWKLRRLL